MIVVFDLDDTLYPEADYVESGFRAVAEYVGERWDVDRDEALGILRTSLAVYGRGRQFDDLVAGLGLDGRQSVPALIRVYRHHDPDLSLPVSSQRALKSVAKMPRYLVTDGHKVVQANKIEALGVGGCFRHCYITHRYGIANRKPSPHCFELIRKRERVAPEEVVYIADDPKKDFLGIRPLGYRTIRVRTGRHAEAEVPRGQDAEVEVADLPAAIEAIHELCWG